MKVVAHSRDNPETPPAASAESKPIVRRKFDAELQAMAKIDVLIAELDSAAQYRILEWLKGRYQSRHTHAPEPEKVDPWKLVGKDKQP